ncbi:hypothetical protein BJ944DRAFT_79321 [Cunninghamella echinulata]|nr:hypothetical protein BJ944DRAFT_79321 [Cunninghamella echinulata]
MLDKQMQDGLSIIDDTWANCVNIILGLIEDSLFDEENNFTKKPKAQYKRQENNPFKIQQPLYISPTESIKRKRRFSDDGNDRKLQKLSDDLANDIARNLSVSTLDTTMDTNHNQHITVSPSRQCHSSFLNYDQRSSSLSPLLPTLRRMSTNEYHDPLCMNENRMELSPLKTITNHHQHRSILSSSPSLLTTSEASSSSSMKVLDLILQQQANVLGISAEEQKQRFEKQRNQFQQYMIQLQNLVNHDHVTFDEIKSFLHTILVLAEEMMGNQSVLFMDIFPEWKLWEGFVQKLVTYVQVKKN